MQEQPTARWWLAVVLFAFGIAHAALVLAQQPLDRLLARIGTTVITLTDVQAAVGLGIIDAKSAGDPQALNQMIDRQLMLTEVARFPPPEPTTAAVDQQAQMLRMHAGAALDALMRSTGLDEAQVRDLARETLRIQAYIAQRFGTTRQVSDDDVRHYYDEHTSEFRRNGQMIPFEEAEAEARKRASAARLQEAVTQWVRDLRMRAEVVEVGKK
jgi:hypothetical protein